MSYPTGPATPYRRTMPPTPTAVDTNQRRSMGQRELLTFVSAAIGLMALAIDAMLPAFDEMRETFGLEPGSTQIGHTLTAFFAGIAIAQLAWGPLTDRFGRRPILYAGLLLYVAGAVASALAPSLGTLIAARFLWGLGAGGPRVVVTAIVRDTYVGQEMARAMSQVMAVFILVPIIAPSLGAAIMVVAPWETIFWLCGVAGVGLGVWAIRLPETLTEENRRPLRLSELRDAGRRIVRTPVTFRTTVASIVIQGAMTLYLTTSEVIVGEVYDRDSWFPFVFGAIAVCLALASITNGRLVTRLGLSRSIGLQSRAMAVTSAALVAITVAFDLPNFYVFHAALALTVSSYMMISPNLNAAGMVPMGDMAGTASSVISATRLGFGAVIAALMTGIIGDSLLGFAIATAVFATTAAAVAAVSTPEDLEAG